MHVLAPAEAVYDIESAGDIVPTIESRSAEGTLQEAVAIAAQYDRAIDTEIRVGKPADEIIEYATESESDQIVIGSHGRSGLSRILMGSVAESVARRGPVPVTIVR